MRLRHNNTFQREGELAAVDLDAAVVDATGEPFSDGVVEGVVDDVIDV